MNESYEDFIGIYTDVFPPGYCQHIIDEFEKAAVLGVGTSRLQSEKAPEDIKSDIQINGSHGDFGSNFICNEGVVKGNTRGIFFDGLQACFGKYSEKYSVLQHNPLTARTFKLQRSKPGDGYHVWHAEQGSGDLAARVLVYILYLNTIPSEEGGETEFLYLRKRFKPVENTLVIWPASFTHAHRGNPVLSDKNKYIATGWFHLD